ncbi:EamA family transporter [Alphaproteobacteria bacterium HT1-32]|nr:EamA family transporter [Alphaproteobacteria bacterium HT1-32]
MKTHSRYAGPTLAVAVASVLWGLYWIPVRWLQSEGPDAVMVAALFNIAALCLYAPVLSWTGRPGWGGLPAGVTIGAAMTLYSLALGMTTVVNAVLLFYLTPVWSTLIGLTFRGERLTLHRATALILSLVGLMLILGDDGGLPLPGNAGDVAALAAGLIWSIGSFSLFDRPAVSVRSATFWTLVSGSAISVLAILVVMPGGVETVVWTVSSGSAILLGGVMLGLLLILTIWGARHLAPARVGILLMGEIVVGVGSAALYAGEPVGLTEIAGGVSILVAAGIEVMTPHKKNTGKKSHL